MKNQDLAENMEDPEDLMVDLIAQVQESTMDEGKKKKSSRQYSKTTRRRALQGQMRGEKAPGDAGQHALDP